MFNHFIASLLGALGGVGIGLLALRYLSAKLIEHRLSRALEEHRHTLAAQLATVQSELSRFSDVLSRRNEREFAVTETAWDLLIRASGTAQERLGGARRVPAFGMMNQRETEDCIATLSLSQEQKSRLRAADTAAERDELWAKFDRRQGLKSALEAWAEFKNFVSTRQIFFNSDIYEEFIKIRDDLYGALVEIETYVEEDERMPIEERIKTNRFLMVELNERIDTLARTIRERFGFHTEKR